MHPIPSIILVDGSRVKTLREPDYAIDATPSSRSLVGEILRTLFAQLRVATLSSSKGNEKRNFSLSPLNVFYFCHARPSFDIFFGFVLSRVRGYTFHRVPDNFLPRFASTFNTSLRPGSPAVLATVTEIPFLPRYFFYPFDFRCRLPTSPLLKFISPDLSSRAY